MDAYEHIIEALERALSEQTSVREHELIRLCQNEALSPLNELNLRNSLDLFRAHFIIRHCLYAIQNKWREQQSAELNIELVVISRQPYVQGIHGLTQTSLLKRYYSDLDNLFNVSESEVEFLLKGFWQRLENDAHRTRALTILNLPSGASYQDIKTRFRKLAQKAHPDKGGSKHEFQEIVEAKQTLDALFR